jgi:hypothetical protein
VYPFHGRIWWTNITEAGVWLCFPPETTDILSKEYSVEQSSGVASIEATKVVASVKIQQQELDVSFFSLISAQW